MEPNKANIAIWADALESGEYTQGEGSLKRTRDNGAAEYCCLGVATVEAAKAGVQMAVRTDLDGYAYYDGESAVLPPAVQRWLGIDRPNPELCSENGFSQGAYWWNDREHKTFPEIAVLIRRTFLEDY